MRRSVGKRQHLNAHADNTHPFAHLLHTPTPLRHSRAVHKPALPSIALLQSHPAHPLPSANVCMHTRLAFTQPTAHSLKHAPLQRTCFQHASEGQDEAQHVYKRGLQYAMLAIRKNLLAVNLDKQPFRRHSTTDPDLLQNCWVLFFLAHSNQRCI